MKFLACVTLAWFLAISLKCQANDLQQGGQLIPVSAIRQKITTAYVTDDIGWCTPAIQVGPKVFITAAHCVPLLDGSKLLTIIGGGVNMALPFKTFSSGPILSDENSLTAPDCHALLKTLKNGDTLTAEQMRICWANNGQSDVALLITDQNVPGTMISIASVPVKTFESFDLLGHAPDCGGNEGFYRLTPFKVFGFINSQVVLDGFGVGDSNSDSWACGGDSGGAYIRNIGNSNSEIAAVHTGGTNKRNLTIVIDGKTITLPETFAGGSNLTEPSVRAWIEQVAHARHLAICGINLTCPDFRM